LCRTLDAVLKQDVPNLQVIVVDNASPDGTVDFVRERYPGVELLALSDNVGIRGRNEGFRAARGDVIVSLDDDIELDDAGALRRIRDRFAALPDLGAVSLRICDDPHGTESAPAHWWHPVPRETHHPTPAVVGCVRLHLAATRRLGRSRARRPVALAPATGRPRLPGCPCARQSGIRIGGCGGAAGGELPPSR
jgi:glycosyltransferase involved in cell wall biosynthesis